MYDYGNYKSVLKIPQIIRQGKAKALQPISNN